MPDIGASLRDARMRARIDVSDIEAQTKIRAKYLRALENEEWDLLPGPTYVKSFLRTYAEALELDAKLLVDEYKLRHERLSDVELQPISPAGRGRAPRRKAPGPPPPSFFVAVIFVGLLFALYLLGTTSDDAPPEPAQTTPPRAASGPSPARPETQRPAPPRTTRLRIEATGPVFVCLRAGDRTLVDGETLQAGDRTRTFRSRRFRLTLGNNAALLRINGHPRRVAASDEPIGLQITPRRGRQPLSERERPVCE